MLAFETVKEDWKNRIRGFAADALADHQVLFRDRQLVVNQIGFQTQEDILSAFSKVEGVDGGNLPGVVLCHGVGEKVEHIPLQFHVEIDDILVGFDVVCQALLDIRLQIEHFHAPPLHMHGVVKYQHHQPLLIDPQRLDELAVLR